MASEFESLQHEAQQLLYECKHLAETLGRPQPPFSVAIGSMIQDGTREAAAIIGAGLTDYIFGRPRIGGKAARKAVDHSRRLQRAQVQDSHRGQALALLTRTGVLISRLPDPIDWRFRSHVANLVVRARNSKSWRTIACRTEGIILEFLAYSPPNDDISVVRKLDRHFREFIEGTLSRLGNDWWTTRVPSEIRLRAEREARMRGQTSASPIDYLTFAEYGRIILSAANWNEAFAAILGDRAGFEDRFRELKGLRNDVAHSRPLSTQSRVRLRELAGGILQRK